MPDSIKRIEESMTASRHLAIDLGAESGRMIEGSIQDGKLHLKEIRRFPTGMTKIGGGFHWNIYRMFEEITAGLEEASDMPGDWDSLGVDTWGVDYGLLDRSGRLIGLPYAYRDPRTDGAMEEFGKALPLATVYEMTGIQMLPFNTLFQLFAERRDHPEIFGSVGDLLFMPDIINYFLTGRKRTEFTFATTSQLFNPFKAQWETSLFELLGIDMGIMQKVVAPCTVLGALSGFPGANGGLAGLPVVSVASHDTASAIAAIPAQGHNWAFISAGTWSLVGFEHPDPLVNQETRRLNFTNEGGIKGFRVLKNMMGFWILQECRRTWGTEDNPYDALVQKAAGSPAFGFFIDPDDPRFLNPSDMPAAIADYCRVTGQHVPAGIAATVRGILESLAMKTRTIIDEITMVRHQPVEMIYITGGGVKNPLFCQFVANATGLTVKAVLAEGTAAGNILAQAMATGHLRDLEEGREVIGKSMTPAVYLPRDQALWQKAYREFIPSLSKRNH